MPVSRKLFQELCSSAAESVFGKQFFLERKKQWIVWQTHFSIHIQTDDLQLKEKLLKDHYS